MYCIYVRMYSVNIQQGLISSGLTCVLYIMYCTASVHKVNFTACNSEKV